MKITNKAILFFIVIFIFGRSSLFAQVTPPPLPQPLHFVINSGIGFPNIAGSSIASQGIGSNSGGSNPVYLEFGYAYSQKGIISLYMSDANAATGNFTFLDTTNTVNTYNYTASIFTLGLSSAYYFGSNPHFKPYVGAMAGYRFINYSANGLLPESGAVNVSVQTFTYHVYGGATWYFIKWMGLDARAGYGNSYYASVGLLFKFSVNPDDDF